MVKKIDLIVLGLVAVIMASPLMFGLQKSDLSVNQIYERHMPAVVEIFAVPDSGVLDMQAGTGFFVSEDGRLATAAHVVFSDKTDSVCGFIFIHLANGSWFVVEPVHLDKEHDIALLKPVMRLVPGPKGRSGLPTFTESKEMPKKFPFLVRGSSKELKAGEQVCVLGYPSVYVQVILTGIVCSSTPQEIGVREEEATYKDLVIMGLQLIPGNSGGPVTDMHGNVVGVATLGSVDKPFSFLQRSEYIDRLEKTDSKELVAYKKVPLHA